jgi:hypothetical protein
MSTTIRNPERVEVHPVDGGPDPEQEDRPSLAARFEAFDQANPLIYQALLKYSYEWIRLTGRRRLGIARLWEKMRWDLETQSTEECPKLNNDYRSFYARKLMQEPGLQDLFETRHSAADDVFGRGSEAA